jgi:hypothetical protein
VSTTAFWHPFGPAHTCLGELCSLYTRAFALRKSAYSFIGGAPRSRHLSAAPKVRQIQTQPICMSKLSKLQKQSKPPNRQCNSCKPHPITDRRCDSCELTCRCRDKSKVSLVFRRRRIVRRDQVNMFTILKIGDFANATLMFQRGRGMFMAALTSRSSETPQSEHSQRVIPSLRYLSALRRAYCHTPNRHGNSSVRQLRTRSVPRQSASRRSYREERSIPPLELLLGKTLPTRQSLHGGRARTGVTPFCSRLPRPRRTGC